MAAQSAPVKAINLKDLNALIPVWLDKKLCEKTPDGRIVVDGKKVGIGKVLSSGSLTFDVEFKNIVLSEKAKAKIEGDEFETESEKTQSEDSK